MSQTEQQQTPILAFLSGDGSDSAGRDIAHVLAFDNRQLEEYHDFIQWLFPLRSPSMAVPGSPVLTHPDIAVIKSDNTIQAALARARETMLRFYSETDHWLVYHNHNHLRITRILASTSLLVSHGPAVDFHAEIDRRVKDAGNPVSPTSHKYWLQALSEDNTPGRP